MASVHWTPTMSHPAMKHPVVFKDYVTVDDHYFVKVAKADGKLTRLLLCKSPAGIDLRYTTVLETLIDRRNKHTTTDEVEDIGIESTPKRRSRALRIVRSRIEVPIDIIVGSPLTSMVVLSGKKSEALWIKLEPSYFDYLIEAIAIQTAGGLKRRSHPRESIAQTDRVEVAQPGICYSHSKKAFRAYRRIAAKTTTKFFRVGDSDMDCTMRKAMGAWVDHSKDQADVFDAADEPDAADSLSSTIGVLQEACEALASDSDCAEEDLGI
jgi:hypothetical protein